MTAKYTIGFRQKTAGFFLLLLCAVSVIKVSHSHPSTSVINQKIIAAQKSDLPGYFTAVAHTQCLICDYQLTKDADADHASFRIISPFKLGVLITIAFPFYLPKAHAFFENRGPPSA